MATFTERLVPFETCFNFRDLGGYETADGRMVRWKTLYRADTLHRLDGAEADALHRLGLRSIIDLRSRHELEDHGRFRHVRGPDLTVHHLPMIDEVGGPNRTMPERPPGEPPRSLGEAYISMLDRGRGAIGRAVTLLARPGALPAVFHCTAGKDRTGVLAAIVLAAVGVRDDDIVHDYMLTTESRDARDAYLRVHEPEYYAFLANLPESIRDMHVDAMPTLLGWVRAEYGSVSGFLLGNGVDEGSLAHLEDALLDG
jgi:protein-tyrosine phosphatase